MFAGYLRKHGVKLALADGVAGFKPGANGSIDVETKSGKIFPANVVILALGVRPDTTLAKMAGLEIGERGGIRVNDQMITSNPDIFAVGDAVEVKDFVTGEWNLVALAGPANRQGRIAADVIAGRNSKFRGTQGTSVIGLFGATAAWTGVSESCWVHHGGSVHIMPEPDHNVFYGPVLAPRIHRLPILYMSKHSPHPLS